jgi:hypothetical protein
VKTYKVIAAMTTYCIAEIQAENEDQAHDIAKNMDGGSFETLRGRFEELGDWHITDISERITDISEVTA